MSPLQPFSKVLVSWLAIMLSLAGRKLWARGPGFLPVRSATEDEHDGESGRPPTTQQHSAGWRPGQTLPVLLTVFLVALVAWTGGYWAGSAANSRCPNALGLLKSPILQDAPVSSSTVRFNGSFFAKTIFRHPASPEVDAAWESLGVNYRASIIPESQAPLAGLSRTQVRVSMKYGGGYPANVEGMHHLHCLNLLRQGLFFNYGYYRALGEGAFKDEDYVVQTHMTHCMDILRQQLMCVVDIGVLGQIWWDPSYPKAFPDFNTEHTCRDFEAVRKWAEEHQGPEHPPDDFLEPPNRGDVLPAIP